MHTYLPSSKINKLIFGTQASPPPDITWLKNGEPVSPWNKIIHADGTLVIPSSKYSDSGVYNIIAKNSSGQASFDIEVRVTDKLHFI